MSIQNLPQKQNKLWKHNKLWPIANVVDTNPQITASDGDPDDQFGSAVAISGAYLAIGAPLDEENGGFSGSVYVYEKTGPGNIWGNEFKITASDGAVGDNFGESVAIDGNYLVVGAWRDDDPVNGSDSGSVYVYERTGPGNTWTNETKIIASDGNAGDQFGSSVAISGNYLAVGAFQGDGNVANSGAVYVYERTSGNTWTNETKIIASDGAGFDLFGDSVAISGNYLAVGAYLDDDNGAQSGSVYVYERTSGNTWTNETKITASDAALVDFFGISVAINGDYLAAGASLDDDNGSSSGSVYIYERTTGNTWTNETKITASDADSFDNFGVSVAISGDYLAVGATGDEENGSSSGSAYVYERTGPGNVWGNETKITASNGAANDNFGESLSIDGNYLAVGVRFDDDKGNDSGSTYVYNIDTLTTTTI